MVELKQREDDTTAGEQECHETSHDTTGVSDSGNPMNGDSTQDVADNDQNNNEFNKVNS